jgi:predicted transcriptional regulator
MTISLTVEMPESLHDRLKKYLESVPCSQDDLIDTAIALFLELNEAQNEA